MGSRSPGFDYTMPYFYMVTIRRNDGYPALSRVCGDAAIDGSKTKETYGEQG